MKRGIEKVLSNRLRHERFSRPITQESVLEFTRHIIAVRNRVGDECWPHVPFRSRDIPKDFKFRIDGYSYASWNSEAIPAHRFSYCLEHGITPSQIVGLHIHHLPHCIGTRCIRPDHLEEKHPLGERGHHGMHRKGIKVSQPTLNARHMRMFDKVMKLPKAERMPEATDKTRFLSNIPFQIRIVAWYDLPDPGRCWEIPPDLEDFLKRNDRAKAEEKAIA